MRAAARYNVAVCHLRRRDYEEALTETGRAQRIAGRNRSLVFPWCARFLEVQLLVNLGRVEEARERWAAISGCPDGEYLRVARWSSELYLCLAEGRHELSDDEIHERAIKGLSMNAGWALMGLGAWAHAASGDDGQARHLLGEAFQRMDGRAEERLSASLPLLHAWMVQHRPATSDLDDL